MIAPALCVLGIVALVGVLIFLQVKFDIFGKTWHVIWAAMQAVADAVWTALKAAGSAVFTAITAAGNAFKTAVLAVWTAIKTAASVAWDAIKIAARSALATIAGPIAGRLLLMAIDKVVEHTEAQREEAEQALDTAEAAQRGRDVRRADRLGALGPHRLHSG